MNNFRNCYEPHLRDYPDCFEECGYDSCEAPLFSENGDPTIYRTCKTCGGEFWNGGTSCTCEVE